MTMVDDGAARAVEAGPAHEPAGRLVLGVAVPCLARPGSGLVHLDGPCQCFCGGPHPVYLDRTERILSV